MSVELFLAFAIADSSTFNTVGATRLFTVRSISRAESALIPRIKSTTSRAFCGDMRMYLASALMCKFLVAGEDGCRLSVVGCRLKTAPCAKTNRRDQNQPTTDNRQPTTVFSCR